MIVAEVLATELANYAGVALESTDVKLSRDHGIVGHSYNTGMRSQVRNA